MAKCIQEIAFDAVEAFWQSAMDGLGISMNETGLSCCDTVAEYICASSPYGFKVDEFEQLAAMLIRALAWARLDRGVRGTPQ
jgi:hypothetical protein